MADLRITKTDRFDIPTLARNKSFFKLSEKRITKAVRDALRRHYGDDRVRVSCSASLANGVWKGVCWIDGVKESYQLHSGPTPGCVLSRCASGLFSTSCSIA
jgi:hypothetical protein